MNGLFLTVGLSKFQVRRRGSNVFSGKRGFITLRDLFRWADRYSKSQDSEGTFFDWNQQLAEDGKLLKAANVVVVDYSLIDNSASLSNC